MPTSLTTFLHRRAWIVIVLAAAGLFTPATSFADTVCSASAAGLNFGPVDGDGNTDSTGTVTLLCSTRGIQLRTIVSVRACLSIGDGGAGPALGGGRRMLNGEGDELRFQIFQDPARSQAWGSLYAASLGEPLDLDLRYQILLGSGASASVQRTMFGRIPAQTGLAAGAYQNAFSGAHTRLDYRFNQNLLIPIYPRSCTQGGQDGGSVSFPFIASASVPGRCTIDSADDLDFGQVPGLIDTNVDQTSTITMTCTNRTAWNLALDEGRNASGTSRRMQRTGGGGHVTYGLYRDAARTQRWGSTPGTDTEQGTGTGLQQSRTVHGRVFPGQSVPAGTYRDTITVTVTY